MPTKKPTPKEALLQVAASMSMRSGWLAFRELSKLLK